MLSICWRINLWGQVRWCKRLNFLLHTFFHSLEHGAATSKHDITEQGFPDVFFTLDDSLVSMLVNTILTLIHLLTPLAWVEEDLWALESLLIHGDRLGAG